jgi:hypothetical protein
MTKYKATFSAHAEVTIEIELDAANQQEALIAAHDLIADAKSSQARIVRLILDRAVNTGLEQAQSDSPPLPPGPHDGYFAATVEAFSGLQGTGVVLQSTPAATFSAAKAILAAAVHGELSPAGSAQIRDNAGALLMTANAVRGGWEVSTIAPAGVSPATGVLRTWLSSKKEAVAIAGTLALASPDQVVGIWDYTSRLSGPKLWKEIGRQAPAQGAG